MSIIFKSNAVSFGNISTQPVVAAATPTVSFLDAEGKSTKTSVNLKSNIDVFALDKSSKFESNYHSIQQSYIHKLLANYDPVALTHPFPKFKPYEDLTGLTTTRPEIVMTMTFKPLFADEKREDVVGRESGQFKTLTNEGELIDAQIQMINLKYEAFVKLISSMKENKDASALLVDGEDQFLAHLDKVTSQVNFLRSVVITLENLKQFLNLRNNRTKVDYVRLVYNYFKSYTDGLVGEIIASFEASTGFFKILGECGFTEANANNFSNTKTYLQSLYELKKLLVCASDEMTGLDGSQKLKDTDPTSMTKTKIIDINRDLSNITDVSPTDLAQAKSATITGLAAKVTAAFNQINSIKAATSDDRIALLYHIISKEYSYSYAFADDSFVRFSEQTFGYRTSKAGNTRMFDSFIGQPGNRIIDNVYSLSPNAAMSVAQQSKGDFIVLTFETDYIDYDASIFSPGSVFYVDEALKISTTGLDLKNPNEIRIIADSQTKIQSTLYKYLIPRLQSSFNNDTAYGEKVSNSKSLFETVMNTFLDPSTKELKAVFANSNLGILFDKATTDSYLKALLFLYFYVRSHGLEGDNAFQQSAWAVVEFITDEITKRLKTNTSAGSTTILRSIGGGNGVSTKVAASIITELKDKSEFTNQFSAQLGVIYDTFVSSKCIDDGVTRYSGMSTSTLIMAIFEMMFSTFSRLNEKKAVSFASSIAAFTAPLATRGADVFHFSNLTSYTLVRKSFFEIISNKLKFENDLVIKIILTHLNMFDSLQNAMRNGIASLQRADNIKSLNDILKVVGSNDQLSLLMNEPQINLVKNAIDDINSKYNARARQNYKKDISRLDVAATYMKTSQNDLVLFDDFLVPGDVKQTLYEYFSNEQFSLNKGFNSRILTVGVPQGFQRYLKEKIALSNVTQQTLNDKEGDIIKVSVYKVDIRYQNIVFKPQTFLFELSRFVSKDYSSYLPVKNGASEKAISDSIPMRDYSIISDSNQQSGMTFGNISPLYQSSEYNFLTVKQKDELMANHIRSHMLELYMKLLSGFSVNELDFLIDESDSKIGTMSQIIVNKLIDESAPKIAPVTPAPGTTVSVNTKNLAQFAIASTGDRATTASNDAFIGLAVAPVKSEENQKKVIVDAIKMKTLYSDTLQEAKRLMKPKMFDRIFNLFVDPDDFDIDHQETIKTDSGKDMLESLFSAGKVIEPLEQSIVRSTQTNMMTRLKLLDKNPKENDAVFEKYFVTLETVMGDLV